MVSRLLRKAALFTLTVCFLSIFFKEVNAQIPGAMNETTATRLGGNSYITGTVFWPSGIPSNARLGIRLKSPTAGEYITTTDERGQFVFSGLMAGSYSVVIDGERDFQAVSQQVEVLESRSRSPQTYTISIRLIETVKAGPKPAVIAAETATVPKRAKEHFEKGMELSNGGNIDGALSQLKLAIAEYPKFTMAFNEIGVQYLKLNDLKKAEEALLEALKINPDAYEPLMNLGIVLFRLNQFYDAESALRKAIVAKSNSAVGHFYLGRTLAKLERYDDAEKELRRSLTLSGEEMKEAHRILAMMFIDKDDREQAVVELETYLRLVPNAPDAEQLKKAIQQLKGPASPINQIK